MIPVFCPSPDIEAELRAAVRLHQRPSLHITRSRTEFEERAQGRPCAVLVCPGVEEAGCAAWIRRLTRTSPATSWIVVAEFSMEKVEGLLDLPRQVGVVWRSEMVETLPERVARSVREVPRDQLARQIAETPGLPPLLSGVLAEACLHFPAPLSVQGLCRVCGMSERGFRSRWAKAVGPSISPKELVDWLVLAFALAEYARTPSWAQVAGELGMKTGTLRRICRRRTGKTLSRLAAKGPGSLTQAFGHWWGETTGSA